MTADAPEDPPEYDLADEPAVRSPAVPFAGAPAPASASGTAPVLPYRTAPRDVVPLEDLYFPSRPRDLYVPAALLVLGLIGGLAGLIYLFNNDVADAIAFGAAYSFVKLLMLGVCIPVMTGIVGVAFGTLPQAVLKLCAIAILPEALGVGIMILLDSCLGPPLGIAAGFFACWAMFALLFEFEPSEARFAAAIYWAIGLIFGVGWLAVLNWLLGWVW
jgi:hypothetical protein